MTDQEQIDRFLTELRIDGELVFHELGGKWHIARNVLMGASCVCGQPYSQCPDNKSLHTPEGFFILWIGMQKRMEWEDFMRRIIKTFRIQTDAVVFPVYYINELTFPRLVAGFFGWKGEE